MDIVKAEHVDIPNSVIVDGTPLINPKELEETLVSHGPINRLLLIDDHNSEFHHHVIVEFKSDGIAMQTLRPLLPLGYKSLRDANVTFNVRALDSVYTHDASSSATNGYLDTLQDIARTSGRSFQEVLQEELTKMVPAGGINPPAQELPNLETEPQNLGSEAAEATTTVGSPHASPEWNPEYDTPKSPAKGLERTATHQTLAGAGSGHVSAMIQPVLSMTTVNPPSVQKIIVEHIVKTEAARSHQEISVRLRVFSGRSPRPNNEPDYDTWRASVELLMTDPSISDLHRTQKIADSLLPPATDVIKQVGPRASPSEYLELLDSVYGSVEDGDDLVAKLMGTFQNTGERPSSYLNRLQITLSTAIRRGGIVEEERGRCLLKQFCRGCWNRELIRDLQLEQKKAQPPSFAELVFLIRTEEDRHAAKEDRMRRHLGLDRQVSTAPKTRTVVHSQAAHTWEDSEATTTETDTLREQVSELQAQVVAMQAPAKPTTKKKPPESAEVTALKRQVVELQAQMTAFRVQDDQIRRNPRSKGVAIKTDHEATEQSYRGAPASSRPRPWYCFHCGEDGHIAPNCEDEPNPALVEEKRHQCKERQIKWDQLNC